MSDAAEQFEVSVIVPARNEAANLADCLRSLIGQAGPSYEVAKQIPRGLKSARDDKNKSLSGTAEAVPFQNRYEIIVVDDHSSDRTRAIAESFPVRVITADPLPEGWSGKCNACWSGARIAQGQWLLFTDADTKHAANSIATGLQEAKESSADLLSYSPKQEVGSLAERALMPLVFAELATKYPPKE